MVNYKCKFCDYETNKMSNMKNHFNKKKYCDIRIKDELYQCEVFNICKFCKFKFNDLNDLKTHVVECKVAEGETIKELLKLNNKLLGLIEEKDKEKEQIIINQTNNNQVINNNFNITINDFDCFTTSHINRNMIFNFFKDRADTRNIEDLNPFMFEMIYCYENSPENHSIYILNNTTIFACKHKKFVKLTTEEINLFLDDIFKGRITFKVGDIFDKGHLKTDNISEKQFNEFRKIFENYQIDTRTLKLSFEQFKPIIDQNIDIIETTIKQINPKKITGELKQIID